MGRGHAVRAQDPTRDRGRLLQAHVEVETAPERNTPFCKNRFAEDSGEFAKEVYERCTDGFLWWGDPYGLGGCTEDPGSVRQPSGYLLPYWMGRYYGFIGAEL